MTDTCHSAPLDTMPLAPPSRPHTFHAIPDSISPFPWISPSRGTLGIWTLSHLLWTITSGDSNGISVYNIGLNTYASLLKDFIVPRRNTTAILLPNTLVLFALGTFVHESTATFPSFFANAFFHPWNFPVSPACMQSWILWIALCLDGFIVLLFRSSDSFLKRNVKYKF